MFSSRVISVALASFALLSQTAALGINCRGSGVCPLAGFENDGNEGVLQGLRDAMYSVDNATVPGSTLYKDGDHVICVSSSIKISISIGVSKGGVSGKVGLNGKLGIGGVCAFPQNTGGAGITLDRARELMDGLLEHGCKVCGSNPTLPGNNDATGELTVNYVKNPDCVGNCLGAGAGLNPSAGKDQSSAPAAPAASSDAPAAPASSATPSSVPAATTSEPKATPTNASPTSESAGPDATSSDSSDAETTSAAASATAIKTAKHSSASVAFAGNATTFNTLTKGAPTGKAGQHSYTAVPYIAYTTVMVY